MTDTATTPAPSLAIAMITDDFLPAQTGVGVHVQKISREMAARGQSVIVITSRRPGQAAKEVWEGVTVYRLFSIPIAGFYQALALRRTVRRIFLQNSIQIVHCHYLSSLMLRAIRVAKDMKVPTVYTTHMTVDHLTQPFFMRPWRPLLRRMIAHLHEKFDHIISVSSNYALRAEKFNVSSQVHYISNPVGFDGTEAVEVEPWTSFRIFFAGRLNEEKDVPLLLRAVQRLKEKTHDVELWIAGEGRQEKELRRLAESLGLSPQVKFLGQVDHARLPLLYSSCNVFVLPSLAEMQPLVALEAMRFRRPVIVTSRIVSARELIDDGKNGFIVEATPENLAEKLDVLRLDPDLCRRQGEAGFEKSASYTKGAVIDSLESLYRSVAQDPKMRFDVSEFHLDKRSHCAFCQIGTYNRRAEHEVVPSNASHFHEEYFGVWRCAVCRSIHSLATFPMEEYYQFSPFRKMHLNVFNRIFLGNLSKLLIRKGVDPNSRILLYLGPESGMFQKFFKENGYAQFDIYKDVLKEGGVSKRIPGFYDAVFVFDYLERTEEPRLSFEIAARQLRPGGLLIVAFMDADKLKLDEALAMQQPYRRHYASLPVLESLAENEGFYPKSIERRSYLDTLVPFLNFRALHDLPLFFDGSIEWAFDFPPLLPMLKKFWRLPRFVYLGFMGGVFRDPCNVFAVFTKGKSTP